MAADLSFQHRPVTELFPRSSSPSDWEDYSLTDAHVAQFHRDGFLPGVRLLSDRQIEALRAELAELVQPGHDGADLWYEYHSNESDDPNAVLFHALGAWRIRPAMHDLLWHPALVGPASQLLGGNPRFWHDQLFCQPAYDGGVVA